MQIDATSNFAVWMKLSSFMEISGTTGVTEIRKRQVQRYYIKLYASYNIKHLDNANVSVEPMEIHGTSPTTMYVLFICYDFVIILPQTTKWNGWPYRYVLLDMLSMNIKFDIELFIINIIKSSQLCIIWHTNMNMELFLLSKRFLERKKSNI